MISTTIEIESSRFWKPTDDPQGTEADPAKTIICMPIVSLTDGAPIQKGVTIAINRDEAGEFELQDIEAGRAYNSILARIIDLAAYFIAYCSKLEYFQAMTNDFTKLDARTLDVINSFDRTDIFLCQLENRFGTIKNILSRRSKK